jgi:N-acyl-D-aspartate/D-glutamate deacylase
VPDRWRQLLAFIDHANADGVALTGQVSPRPIGALMGLSLSSHPFSFSPTYRSFEHLSLTERVAMMRRPEIRDALLREEPVGLRRAADITPRWAYELGDPPNYEPAPEDRLELRAKALGISTLELAYDLLLKDDGQNLLYLPITNFAHTNLDSTLEMMQHPHTVVALGDGGAHVARICDASNQTYVLTHWTRDRPGPHLPLGRAVQMLSADPARVVGLEDRGILAAGYRGDLNVIDYRALRLAPPRIVHDLPAGGMRLKQSAAGYRATVKSGAVTYRDGVATGALPGRLIRGAQSSPR